MKIKSKAILSRAWLFMGFFLISTVTAMAVPVHESQFVVNSESIIDKSSNWAGYATYGGTYTSINGSWLIPQINNPTVDTADASWIGIGGVTSRDLIQTGTQAVVNSTGQVNYQAWYELLPSESVPISISISPGDSITASIIQQQNNQWSISIRDDTNGQNFQTTVTYYSSLSSAEWIEEMLSTRMGRRFIPLDNFGTVQFSDASTVKNGITMNLTQAGAGQITMTNGMQVLATPSVIDSNGTFTVTRTSATYTPMPFRSFGRRGWHRY